MDVSDRRMQVVLTLEARIASDFLYIRAILAVVGFVSALKGPDSSNELSGPLSAAPSGGSALGMRARRR